MAALQLVAAIALGYLLGAIPSGVLVGRLRGVDPRDTGSGRTGTTNAIRTMGMRWAALVAVLDVGKGIAAVLLGTLVGPEPWAGALAGVAAVAGLRAARRAAFRSERARADAGRAGPRSIPFIWRW